MYKQISLIQWIVIAKYDYKISLEFVNKVGSIVSNEVRWLLLVEEKKLKETG